MSSCMITVETTAPKSERLYFSYVEVTCSEVVIVGAKFEHVFHSDLVHTYDTVHN